MLTICYLQTHSNLGFHYFDRSLKRANIPVENIVHVGFGEKFQGWKWRMEQYLKVCEQRHDDDIILFTDADDVLLLENLSTIQERFRQYDTRLLVSSERGPCGANCTPLDKFWKVHQLPDLLNRYVNGGGIMGYASDLTRMWKWGLENEFTDDQKMMGAYLNEFPDRGFVDIHQEIFYCANRYATEHYSIDASHTFVIRVDESGEEIRPCLIHFAYLEKENAMLRALQVERPSFGAYDSAVNVLFPQENLRSSSHTHNVLSVSSLTWLIISVCLMVVIIGLAIAVYIYHRKLTHKTSTEHLLVTNNNQNT